MLNRPVVGRGRGCPNYPERPRLCASSVLQRGPQGASVCWRGEGGGGLPIPSCPHLKGGPTIPQSSGQNPLQPPTAQAPGLS